MLRVSQTVTLDVLGSVWGQALGLMPKRQTPCIVQPVQGLGFGVHAFGTQAKVTTAEVPWKWLFICRSHMDFLSGKCS